MTRLPHPKKQENAPSEKEENADPLEQCEAGEKGWGIAPKELEKEPRRGIEEDEEDREKIVYVVNDNSNNKKLNVFDGSKNALSRLLLASTMTLSSA